MIRGNRLSTLVAAVALVGCSEIPSRAAAAEPALPAPASAHPLLAVTCSADIATRAVRCGEPGAGQASRDVIVGGQGTYVYLVAGAVTDEATDCSYAVVPDPAMHCYSFDVTVENVLAQTIGTVDGTTRHTNGVRVFFQNEPTSTGTGSLRIANPDNWTTFTATNQPYYQYDTFLPYYTQSFPKRWAFQHTPDVTRFVFTVYVSTPVQFPNGYVTDLAPVVTLAPGESLLLPGVVRNFLGVALPGQPLDFTSANPAVVTTSGATVTAGAMPGATSLGVTSGGRPGLDSSRVAVCPSVLVAHGTALAQSLSGSDCRSALFRTDGSVVSYRPSTVYYGDLYQVSLTAGQTVEITMDTNGGLNSRLILADRLGNMLVDNDDDPQGTLGSGSRITYVVPMSGVYVIQATTGTVNGTGPYTLGVSVTN